MTYAGETTPAGLGELYTGLVAILIVALLFLWWHKRKP